MKQLFATRKGIIVTSVPSPSVEAGQVLVRVEYSCISVGTEISGLKSASESLLKKVLRAPDKIVQAAQMARDKGLAATVGVVSQKLSSHVPLGYSVSGRVVAVGAGVSTFAIGERVACSGAKYANHASVVAVPVNLVVHVPERADLAAASSVALGAIALQGIRRSQAIFGDTVVVVGMGVIGLIVVQLAVASGCRVTAVDPVERRRGLAVKLGAEAAVDPTHAGCEDTVRDLCHGAGADAVIVTAGAVTAEPLTFACRVCRKKGKVVLVGDVPIEIARSEIYEKELDFLISSSYGPGRYDTSYEEDGRDYPRAYVRWTENRNMQAYLEALASATVSLAEIVAEPSSIEGAAETYSLLQQRDGPLCAIFSYGDDDGAETVVPVPIIRGKPVPVGRLGVAVIGTGAFARAVHLPNLQRLKADCSIQCVVSRTGATAVDVARVYGAAHAETDPERVFDDPSIDAVIVTSRHDSHADLVLSALRSGKAVLVEKPLCLTRSELEAIRFQCQGKSDTPLLLTGFNRRFAPLVIELATILENRVNPVVINYTVNAGFIAGDSWVHGSTGGGRNIGEACHIYDLFTFLVGGKLTRMSAISAAFGQSAYSFTDNFVATARFDDGSVATLTYTALGNASFSKERMEVFVDGAVLVLDDFKSLCSYGGKPLHLSRRRQDKGHFNELQSFVRGIRTGEWPAPLWQQLQAMEMAFAVEDCIRGTV